MTLLNKRPYGRVSQMQPRAAGQRNPKKCSCQHTLTDPPEVALKKRGVTHIFQGTAHGAKHVADCPHSEFAATTREFTTSEKRQIRRLKTPKRGPGKKRY